MKLILPVSAACKKLSAIFSDIFSANNRAGILNEEWIQYKDVISGTPDVSSNNITTPTPNNNISDDAKQCNASFLFMPVTAISDHLPYTKKSTIRSFLHSSKTNVCNISSFQNFLPAVIKTGCSGIEINTNSNSFFSIKKIASGMMAAFFVSLLMLVGGLVSAQTVVTISTSGTFTVPLGVTSITVYTFGGGGAGGGDNSNGGSQAAWANGGGGGGGAATFNTLTVVSGQVYTVTIGAGGTGSTGTGTAGGTTTFTGIAGTITAGGGGGGIAAINNSAQGTNAGGAAGITGSGGTTKAGGAGSAGNNGKSSGTLGVSGTGGGGGGQTGIGGTPASVCGVTGTGGTGTFPGGTGQGNTACGVASSHNNGTTGSVPGGGGGGDNEWNSGTANGGNGGAGEVIVTYTCTPPAAPNVSSPINYCLNSTAIPLAATGSGLLWYTGSTGGTGSSTAPTPGTAAAGTTSYYVSQSVGCEGPRAQINVIVNALPLSSVTSQTNITCFSANNGTITVSASGGTAPYTFSVDNGINFLAPTGTDLRLFTGLLPNNPYRIKVKDNNQCISK